MKTTDLTQFRQEISNYLQDLDTIATDSLPKPVIADWIMSVYTTFDREKVITNRLQGLSGYYDGDYIPEYDYSIVLSHYRIAIINNLTGIASWFEVREVITYEDEFEDIDTLVNALNVVLLRLQFNEEW